MFLHTQVLPNSAGLPYQTALGKTWNGMEWIGMEFYHEFLE